LVNCKSREVGDTASVSAFDIQETSPLPEHLSWSSEPERIFSNAGVVLAPRRSRLKEDILQSTICLANWGRAGIITLREHRQRYQGSKLAEDSNYVNVLYGKVGGDGNTDDDDKLFEEEWDNSIGGGIGSE